jgi:hypothetical protein
LFTSFGEVSVPQYLRQGPVAITEKGIHIESQAGGKGDVGKGHATTPGREEVTWATREAAEPKSESSELSRAPTEKKYCFFAAVTTNKPPASPGLLRLPRELRVSRPKVLG